MGIVHRIASLYTRRSLIFRLWLALSAVSLALAFLGAFAYIKVTLDKDVDSARQEMGIKQEALEVFSLMTQRLQAIDSFSFAHADYSVLRDMGIRGLYIYDSDGNLQLHIDPEAESASIAESYVQSRLLANLLGYEIVADAQIELDAGVAERARQEGPQRVSVTFPEEGDGVDATPIELTSWQVVRGGSFGEHYWTSPAPAVLQLAVFEHPNLASNAQELLITVLLAVTIICCLISAIWWVLLHRMIYRPLLAYSDIALDIAAGSPVRMPVAGEDEMAGLARAVNGMADILVDQATVDPLTGLNNLRHMTDQLERLIRESTATGEPLALLVGDLDRFKTINDTYGHPAGDQVLQSIGAALRRWSDGRFYCWRLGGDEFAIALPNCEPQTANEHAASLRRLISGLTVRVPDGLVQPRISVGVATAPADGDTTGGLLSIADRRMYEVKRGQESRARLSA